jgi:hypothetical protein
LVLNQYSMGVLRLGICIGGVYSTFLLWAIAQERRKFKFKFKFKFQVSIAFTSTEITLPSINMRSGDSGSKNEEDPRGEIDEESR